MKQHSALRLAAVALFAALTAAAAQFSIPAGPVPVSLATFAVYLAGGVLGSSGGAASQVLYVLLGAVGLPVFAGFRAGAAALFGPTGGYLIGYIACAGIVGAVSSKTGRKTGALVLSMILGTAALYFLGTVWFVFLTGRGLWEALLLCVFPFLPGDAAKIIVCAMLAPRLGTAFDRICAGAA